MEVSERSFSTDRIANSALTGLKATVPAANPEVSQASTETDIFSLSDGIMVKLSETLTAADPPETADMTASFSTIAAISEAI